MSGNHGEHVMARKGEGTGSQRKWENSDTNLKQ